MYFSPIAYICMWIKLAFWPDRPPSCVPGSVVVGVVSSTE